MRMQTFADTSKPLRRMRAWTWIGQAAIAIGVAAVGMAAWMARAPDNWTTYASGPTELRSIALPDGTRVQLDHDSVLAVRFDARQRSIDVLRGGALFDVGHDAKRRLRVMLGANELQDMGTVFDAHQSADGGNVTVLSGRVKVWQQERDARAPADGDSAARLIADLGAGQQASMRRDGSLDLIDHHADIGRSTAWLPKDIHFEHATVADVARQFNAYSSHPLRIDNASIAATRISGRFHARDMEAFIAYLGALPGVRIVRGADDVRVTAAIRGKRDERTL